MAIGTDAAIEFFGTQDALDDTSGSVADAAFSASSDLLTWTNDDDAITANLVFSGTYASAPDASSSVNCYVQLLNIDGSTGDQDAPDANFQHTYVGSFPLNDVTSAQLVSINISLPNVITSQIYQFYIENTAGQTLSAGWEILVTPKAIGPHA